MIIHDVDEKEKKMYDAFVQELTDADDVPPHAACRDAKFFLDLQKKKMQSLGIKVKYRLKLESLLTNLAGSRFEGLKYTGDRLFRGYAYEADYYHGAKKILTHKERLILYQMLVSTKDGVESKDTYACPSCGAISTFEQLEQGCPYCGSHFLMAELFPKVTQFFWLHDLSMTGKDFVKGFAKWMSGGLIVGLALGLLLVWYFPFPNPWYYVIVTAIMGALTGGFLMLPAIFLKLIVSSVKNAPLMAKTAGDKKRMEEAMQKYDPYFFYELFESRVISLLSVMLYGDDFSDNALYCGKKDKKPSDVIDMSFRGALDIEKIDPQGDFIYITLTVYTTCLHVKKTKLVRQEDAYRMIVVRNIHAPSNPGFTIQKVDCISCGGSFNASQVKSCPYCNREFRLYDYDWVVYDFTS